MSAAPELLAQVDLKGRVVTEDAGPRSLPAVVPGVHGAVCPRSGGCGVLGGKALRRSYNRAEGRSPLQLVRAWADEQRLVLGQLAAAGKSKEIAAEPQLLKMLTLRGQVVTAGAMHCQRQAAQ